MRLPRPRGVSLGVADQVLSSFSNLLLSLLVIRVASSNGYGVFAGCLTAVTALLTVFRAGLGTQLALAAKGDEIEVRRAANQGLSTLFLLSPLIMSVVGMVGLLIGKGEFWPVVVVFTLVAPFLLAQDLLRFHASALNRPGIALLGDSLWLATLTIAAGWAWLLGRTSEGLLVGAWAWGCMLALAVMARRLGLDWSPSGVAKARGELLTRDHLGATVGSSAVSISSTARLSLIGYAAGSSTVGALAAAQFIWSPMNLLAALVPFLAAPGIARKTVRVRAIQAYGRLTIYLLAACFAWFVVCSLTPDTLGLALVGSMWWTAQSLLIPTAVLTASVLAGVTAMTALLHSQKRGPYLFASVFQSLVILLGALLGICATGDVGVLAWTQAVAVLAGSALAWALALSPR